MADHGFTTTFATPRTAALAATIAHFSHLAADCPELVELELNPLVAHATGVVTVDARARLVSPPSRAASSANAEREPA